MALTGFWLPCGYLGLNVSAALLDEAGAPAEPGAGGELVVRGRYIASGRWRNGGPLPGPFRPDPASRIFPAGDLIRVRSDGLAEFVGRSDRRVKTRGLRADPGDVEAALHRIAGIPDCAVVTVASQDDTAFPAHVVLTGPDSASIRSIRAALRAEPAPHMMPAEIHPIDRIPRLPSFKPDLLARQPRDRVATAP